MCNIVCCEKCEKYYKSRATNFVKAIDKKVQNKKRKAISNVSNAINNNHILKNNKACIVGTMKRGQKEVGFYISNAFVFKVELKNQFPIA